MARPTEEKRREIARHASIEIRYLEPVAVMMSQGIARGVSDQTDAVGQLGFITQLGYRRVNAVLPARGSDGQTNTSLPAERDLEPRNNFVTIVTIL